MITSELESSGLRINLPTIIAKLYLRNSQPVLIKGFNSQFTRAKGIFPDNLLNFYRSIEIMMKILGGSPMKTHRNLIAGLLVGVPLLLISTGSQAGIFSFQIGYSGYSHHYTPRSSHHGYGYYHRPKTHYYGYSPYNYYGHSYYHRPKTNFYRHSPHKYYGHSDSYGHQYKHKKHYGNRHHNYGHKRHISKIRSHRRHH